jgi:hypothetical protein
LRRMAGERDRSGRLMRVRSAVCPRAWEIYIPATVTATVSFAVRAKLGGCGSNSERVCFTRVQLR